jgi:hypothetical protein
VELNDRGGATMKKTYIFIFLSFIFTIPIHSQSVNDTQIENPFSLKQTTRACEFDTDNKDNMYYQLGEEKQKEYVRNRLTVEITKLETGIDFSSRHNRDYQMSFDWTAFKGINRPISKEEFLDITGYKLESAQERSKKNGEALSAAGLAVVLTGLVLAILPLTHTDINTDMNSKDFGKIKHHDPNIVPGLLICGCGFGLYLCGYQKSGNHQIPFSVAQRIAEEYNHNLLLNIQKSL